MYAVEVVLINKSAMDRKESLVAPRGQDFQPSILAHDVTSQSFNSVIVT